ncbi:MAG: hypothetical protein HY846_03380 [Nitrosomonadales bacterium]|nr:hypothetical protein [Nitrosomonadales bacterium]
MKCKFKFSTVMELGVGAAAIAAIFLAGCGGGGGGGGGAVAGASMVITPALGQFANGTTVRVKDKNGTLLVTSTVNASGVAAVTVPAGATAPLLVEAGINGDKYFDENPAAAGRDANGFVAISGVTSAAVRALVPDTTTTAVGVTALTEMAVGQVEAASGIAATPVSDIRAVNQTIGDTMGVTDILQPPTPVTTATRLNTTSVAADRYALLLAGLAHMAATGKTALDVTNDLRNDVKDGKFDGRIGSTAATAFDPAKFTPPALGATNTAIGTALTAALNNTLSTATTQLALSGTAPTVTIATVDLSAYKAAIIAVQATAPSGAGQVASAQSFPLQSGYNARVANGYSANYTISGTCSGTESIVWSPPVAGIFEGASALGAAASYTFTITTPSCGAAASGATTGTRYYDTSYAYLGSSFPGQYTVPTSPITIPASVKVADTGTLGTASIYTDSTKAVLLGQYVFSYAVELDTASTAIINLITKLYSSSVLIATEQERSRIASDGTLTPISIDKQSNTSADHLILIATGGSGAAGGTGAGAGVTFSGALGGFNSVANTSFSNGVYATGGRTVPYGVSFVWEAASGAVSTLIYDSIYSLVTVTLGTSGYGTTCGIVPSAYTSAYSLPICSSTGVTFDRAAGTITFASTPLYLGVIPSQNSSTGITATGSLSFTPF